MALDDRTQQDAIDFLVPFVPDQAARQALITEALGADSPELRNITWTGSPQSFLAQIFGALNDKEAFPGRNALVAILGTVRRQINADQLPHFNRIFETFVHNLEAKTRRDFTIPGYVFVSHSSEDNAFVRRLASSLNGVVAEVWIDLQKLKGGHHWRSEIYLALERAESVIICLTRDAIHSRWVRREISSALLLNKQVFPLMVEECFEEMQQYEETQELLEYQFIDFVKHIIPDAYNQAVNRLITQLSDPQIVRRSPFKGLEAFQEADAAYFFGRDAQIAKLVARIKRPSSARFLAVVGASGSGKSSLVRAGLLPVIRQGSELDSVDWRRILFTPGEQPLRVLSEYIQRELGPEDRTVLDVFNRLKQDALSLHTLTDEILARLNAPPSARFVYVIDQFEELFTRVQDEAEQIHFLDLLFSAATEPDGRSQIIITMRADYLDRFGRYPNMAELIESDNLVFATDLKPSELLECIEGPARVAGLIFESGLSNEIVQDLTGQPGALPLLQFALKQLHEHREARRITRESYRAIGGVQEALAQHAEEVYIVRLDQPGQEIARRIFLELARFDRETRSATSRPRTLAALRGMSKNARDVQLVIDVLTSAENRLLVTERRMVPDPEHPGENQQETWLHLSHEALLQRWQRYVDWMQANSEALRLRDELEQEAQDWLDSERNDAYLLRGIRLDSAQEWLAAPHAQDFITPLQREFIGASVEHFEREEARERQRFQRELELERANTLQQKRATRRLRLFLGTVTTLLLITIALAIFALYQREQTQQREQEAYEAEIRSMEALADETRQLAVRALLELASDPATSIDLSMRALRTIVEEQAFQPLGDEFYIPEAELALSQAIQLIIEEQKLTSTFQTTDQLAFGEDWIALGGDSLELASYDLTERVVLSEASTESYAGVVWASTGDLLSYGGTAIEVWEGQQQVMRHELPESIQGATWHPAGDAIALYSTRTLWLWEADTETQFKQFPHTWPGDIQTVMWSPDGRWLAVLGYDYLALVGTPALQRSTDDIQRMEQYGEGFLRGVRWSGDSSAALVFGDLNSPAQIVPTAEGSNAISLEGHTKAVREATFIDDQIITYSDDGTARMWTAQGDLVRSFGLPTVSTSMRGGVFSNDSTRLLTFLDNGEASIWDVDSGELITTLSGHAGSIVHAAWHGAYVVTTAADNTARIWNAANGQALTTLRGHTQRVFGSRWIDPQRLLTYGADGSLRVWQIFNAQGVLLCEGVRSDGVPLCRAQSVTFAVGENTGSTSAAWWQDDSTVNVMQFDGSLRQWMLPSGDERDALAITDHFQVVWEPHGSRVLTYNPGEDGEIIDLDTGDSVSVAAPVEAAFWLDAGLLISEGTEGARWFASPTLGSEPMRLDHLDTHIIDADIYAGEELLATTLAEERLIVTNVRTGEQIKELALDASARDTPEGLLVLDVTWTGNGTRLLTIDSQGWTHLWELDTGKPVWSSGAAAATEAQVTAADAAVSPTGERVAIMAAFNLVAPERVYVLETRTGELKWSIDTRHEVLGVQWSPNGDRVLTWGQADREAGASDNGIARVWDVVTQAEVLRLTDTEIIFSAAFNGSGTSILTRNQAGVARVWPAWPNRDSLPSLIAFAEACCTPQEDVLEE